MNKIDERGKYFTERITTHTIEVLVQTVYGQVRGHLHIKPGQRIKDALNEGESFIALTRITMTDAEGVQEIRFVALNKQHIISVVPLQEESQVLPQEEHYPY